MPGIGKWVRCSISWQPCFHPFWVLVQRHQNRKYDLPKCYAGCVCCHTDPSTGQPHCQSIGSQACLSLGLDTKFICASSLPYGASDPTHGCTHRVISAHHLVAPGRECDPVAIVTVGNQVPSWVAAPSCFQCTATFVDQQN